MSCILALAAHPDDVEIGCGGTLANYADRGAAVHLFVASDGSRGGDANTRRLEQESAARLLGVCEIHWGGLPDTQLPGHAERLIGMIEQLARSLRPLVVLVNHEQDTHQDHRALAQAAASATRYVPSVMAYETPTTIGFNPTLFMDVTASMPRKIQALAAHTSQLERTNIQGLNIIDVAVSTAHFRGIQGRINSAEGFVPIRVQL